jgi:hypothetical protein
MKTRNVWICIRPISDIVDQNGTDVAESADDKGTLAIVDTVAEEKQVEQAIDEVKDVGKENCHVESLCRTKPPNGRWGGWAPLRN